MSLWRLHPEDGTMRRIAKETAIQTSVRRACLITREFTGLEVMPEEMSCTCVETLAILGRIWEQEGLSKRKPDSVVNFASCMAVMEWCHSVRKSDNKPYELVAAKLAGELDFIATELEYLFPGCMAIKNANQCVYDGVSVTADGCERQGWQWTKKLNEKFVALMSLYPILRSMANNSVKMAEVQEALSHREKRKD